MFLAIAWPRELGFGRYLVGILPTDLLYLPVPLRDLENKQKHSEKLKHENQKHPTNRL